MVVNNLYLVLNPRLLRTAAQRAPHAWPGKNRS